MGSQQTPLVHETYGQTVGRQVIGMGYLRHTSGFVLHHPKGHTRMIYLRQRHSNGSSIGCHKPCFSLHSIDRSEREHSASTILHKCRVAIIHQTSFGPLPIVPRGFESHSAGKPCHQIASFGVQGDLKATLLRVILVNSAHGTQGHIPREVTRNFRPVVYREHATV